MKRWACGVVEVPKPPCTAARRFFIPKQPKKAFPMLKLHAGVSKKIGLPGFSSASASCTIEAELDSSLLNDGDGFQVVVKRAYQSCEKAVQDQIARLTGTGTHDIEPGIRESHAQPVAHEVIEVRTSPAITGATITAQSRTPSHRTQTQTSPRPATASQVKAIRAIASRRRIDLVGLLRERFGLQTADELGIRQASELIDELKSDDQDGASVNGHTNGTYATNGGAR